MGLSICLSMPMSALVFKWQQKEYTVESSIIDVHFYWIQQHSAVETIAA